MHLRAHRGSWVNPGQQVLTRGWISGRNNEDTGLGEGNPPHQQFSLSGVKVQVVPLPAVPTQREPRGEAGSAEAASWLVPAHQPTGVPR